MATHPRAFDPDDLLELERPEGIRGYELVNGELLPLPHWMMRHGWLASEIGRRLANHLEASSLGGRVYVNSPHVFDLAYDPKRTRLPDVAYIGPAKLQQHYGLYLDRPARFAPDLAIELDVTTEYKPDAKQRIRDYVAAGVPLVWALQPRRRRATVYRADGTTTLLTDRDALDGGTVIPGFTLPLGPLFDAAADQ